MQNKVVVFDLEDTLYKEVDFLKSGFHAVDVFLSNKCRTAGLYVEMWKAYQAGEKDVFKKILDEHRLNIDKSVLIDIYRYHIPQLQMDDATEHVLEQLHSECHLALITDGRTRTKRNVIIALGIPKYIDWSDIYVSEDVGCLKTEPCSFNSIMEKHPDCQYIYVGDNPEKDFVIPNQLGWDTICLLDDGRHIHKQDFSLNVVKIPKHTINNIKEVLNYV